MNISKKAWNKYISTVAKLDDKAASLIKEWVNANGLMNRDALIDYTFDVVQTLSLGSGALAVDWYEAIAELEGVVIPSAEIAELPTYADVAKTVNGVMKRSLNADTIASAASMLVKRTAADTTLYNAKRDGAEFAWIPVGDTCPFCMQLASYGWRRASEKTVKGDHAEHIHPNCDCEFAIRFGNDLKYSSYDPDKYKEIYENAEGNTVAEKRNSIRRMQYQENKDRINAQKRAAYAKRNNSLNKILGNGKINAKIEFSEAVQNANSHEEIRQLLKELGCVNVVDIESLSIDSAKYLAAGMERASTLFGGNFVTKLEIVPLRYYGEYNPVPTRISIGKASANKEPLETFFTAIHESTHNFDHSRSTGLTRDTAYDYSKKVVSTALNNLGITRNSKLATKMLFELDDGWDGKDCSEIFARAVELGEAGKGNKLALEIRRMLLEGDMPL